MKLVAGEKHLIMKYSLYSCVCIKLLPLESQGRIKTITEVEGRIHQTEIKETIFYNNYQIAYISPWVEVKGKFLLLKCYSMHFRIRTQRPRLELTWRPSWGLAFMVPESAMRTSRGGKQPTVLLSYGAHEPQWPVQHYNPKGAAVTHLPVENQQFSNCT